jgi:outer membrane protein assembly factor BamA
VFDAREPRANPRSGLFLGAAVWRFDARGTGEFDFTRIIADGRSYLTPLGKRGVLAVRALLSVDMTDADARVPFYLQQTLGGAETLRGFPSYRFRDRTIAAASAEYRWQAIEYVDAGPFIDIGAAGGGPSRLSMRDAFVTYGVRAGIRYGSRALFHFDLGKSREGLAVTAGTGVLF